MIGRPRPIQLVVVVVAGAVTVGAAVVGLGASAPPAEDGVTRLSGTTGLHALDGDDLVYARTRGSALEVVRHELGTGRAIVLLRLGSERQEIEHLVAGGGAVAVGVSATSRRALTRRVVLVRGATRRTVASARSRGECGGAVFPHEVSAEGHPIVSRVERGCSRGSAGRLSVVRLEPSRVRVLYRTTVGAATAAALLTEPTLEVDVGRHVLGVLRSEDKGSLVDLRTGRARTLGRERREALMTVEVGDTDAALVTSSWIDLRRRREETVVKLIPNLPGAGARVVERGSLGTLAQPRLCGDTIVGATRVPPADVSVWSAPSSTPTERAVIAQRSLADAEEAQLLCDGARAVLIRRNADSRRATAERLRLP